MEKIYYSKNIFTSGVCNWNISKVDKQTREAKGEHLFKSRPMQSKLQMN
jgi:hypothetical protein